MLSKSRLTRMFSPKNAGFDTVLRPQMPAIHPRQFRRVYRQSVRDVMRFIDRERQMAVARHDASLHPDRHDLGVYLQASERRYAELVQLYNAWHRLPHDQLRALDVGGFLGAYPLTLARLGISVTLAEEYGYYYGAFDELAGFLAGEGVDIWAVDFTEPISDTRDGFTLVSNMAMLEHLPGSPRGLMENIRSCIDPDGLLIVEIPNVAYWPNRLEAIRGQSIHQPLELVYASEMPYLGHHREYTVAELQELLRWSRFVPRDLKLFNYSLSLRRGTWTDRLYTLLVYLWPTIVFPACREIIMAVASPASESD
jgi:2-polyprenyl-3-methyl-5-hydroxy-6-metoxy-1,4-benzoquinol methylase